MLKQNQKLSAKKHLSMQEIDFNDLVIKHAWLGVNKLARGGGHLERPLP